MEDIELSPQAQREQAELQESTDRTRTERQRIDAQNRDLRTLIEREENLAAHLRNVLKSSRAERRAIEKEKTRILSSAGR